MMQESIDVLCIGFTKAERQLLEAKLSDRGHPLYTVYFSPTLDKAVVHLKEMQVILLKLTKSTMQYCDDLLKAFFYLPIILFTRTVKVDVLRDYLSRGVQDHVNLKHIETQPFDVWGTIDAAIYRMRLLWVLQSENDELSQVIMEIRRGNLDSIIIGHGKKSMKNHLITVQSRKEVAKRQVLLEKMEYLAKIDHLTHIANRLCFDEELKKSVSRAVRHQSQFALLLVDIDHFKAINDTLGHEVGDRLLKNIATRIQTCIRTEDTFARLGGDEFAVIVEGIQHSDDASKVGDKILNLFMQPFRVLRKKVHVTVSIGIVCFPCSARDAGGLLKNVDVALYRAKNSGRNSYQYYEEVIDQEQKRVLKIEHALHSALAYKEFSVVYQPIVNLKTQKLCYYEALLRWKNKELGEVSPAEFIPIAELSGMIFTFTIWILEEVFSQLSEWLKSNIARVVPVSINLSANDLWQESLVEIILEKINQYKIPLSLVQFEVTETAIMEHPEKAEQQLLALDKLNIRVVLDDFGTGYSSLSRIQKLPLTGVKIDLSFIAEINISRSAYRIVKAVINLSRQLGLKTIAEGVEDEKQLKLLLDLKCDYGQGYLFSKPLPKTKVASYTQKHVSSSKINFDILRYVEVCEQGLELNNLMASILGYAYLLLEADEVNKQALNQLINLASKVIKIMKNQSHNLKKIQSKQLTDSTVRAFQALSQVSVQKAEKVVFKLDELLKEIRQGTKANTKATQQIDNIRAMLPQAEVILSKQYKRLGQD